MRWWKLGLGVLLLGSVLGTAYVQARRRGRRIGPALLLVEAAVCMFAAAAFAPLSGWLAAVLVVASVASLALAMAVVLWKGFVR